MSKNKDLTVGNPSRVLWMFCLPMFGSIVFQQLYNIADSFIAGKFIGENALAAVGNSYEITLIFIGLAFGCNMGCSVIVSNFFGAKNYGSVKTAVYTSYIACAVTCAVLMAVGFLFGNPLLRLIDTPAEVFADSSLYLRIYVLGVPFVFFYNVSSGIFSALGDSKTPFLFLAASSLSNIALDILFVAGFGMGVDGVAWATFICQGVSCLLAVFFVLRRLSGIPTEVRAPLFSRSILWSFLRIAVPSALQQSFISVGNIIIQGVINGFGPAVMAGYSASVKLNNLVTTSFTTIGNGISNFTAQNRGAGQNERVKKGFSAGLRMVWNICLPFMLLYFLAGPFLIRLFMDAPTEAAVSCGVAFLRILSPFYLVIATKFVSDGVLRGAGLMQQFLIATFTDLILRVGLAFAFSATSLGSVGIWCAWPIGWVVATGMSVGFYAVKIGKKK